MQRDSNQFSRGSQRQRVVKKSGNVSKDYEEHKSVVTNVSKNIHKPSFNMPAKEKVEVKAREKKPRVPTVSGLSAPPK